MKNFNFIFITMNSTSGPTPRTLYNDDDDDDCRVAMNSELLYKKDTICTLSIL